MHLVFGYVRFGLQIIFSLFVCVRNVGIIIGRRNVKLQALSLFDEKSILVKAKIQHRYAVFAIITKLIAKGGNVVAKHVGMLRLFYADPNVKRGILDARLNRQHNLHLPFDKGILLKRRRTNAYNV